MTRRPWRTIRRFLLRGDRLTAVGGMLLVAGLCGCEDAPTGTSPPPPPRNSAEVLQHLASAYQDRNLARFTDLLAADFVFEWGYPLDNGATEWNRDIETNLHRRMFDPASIPADESPIQQDLWVQSIEASFTIASAFVERPDLYATAQPPGVVDPQRWIARSARFQADAFFQLRGETDFAPSGAAEFVVLEDRTKSAGDAAKFVLHRWEELDQGSTAKSEERGWSRFKAIYMGPRDIPEPRSNPGYAIERLLQSYRMRRPDPSLFAEDFRFLRNRPDPMTGETSWGVVEERVLHERMFDPAVVFPPVPEELRLQSLTVAFLRQHGFVERRDYYATANPPGPLDPARWRAYSAEYRLDAFFSLQGATDYSVVGGARFVVVEDRAAPVNGPTRVQLYRWEDLSSAIVVAAVAPASWTAIKSLYRAPPIANPKPDGGP